MEEKYIECSTHGKQAMALLCQHLGQSLHDRIPVGFLEYDAGDTGRPDAWCNACEAAWNRTQTEEDRDQWFIDCQHKLVCVSCWDEAKALNRVATHLYFKLFNLTAIKNLMLDQTAGSNFSKTVHFPFPPSYPLFAIRPGTTTISSEAIFYDTFEATRENETSDFPMHWIFAGNGQGDRWLFDQTGQVFFGDHDQQPMELYPMFITFEQWLQLAFVIQQLDDWLDAGYDPQRVAQPFNETLNLIHPQLAENYPFEIM